MRRQYVLREDFRLDIRSRDIRNLIEILESIEKHMYAEFGEGFLTEVFLQEDCDTCVDYLCIDIRTLETDAEVASRKAIEEEIAKGREARALLLQDKDARQMRINELQDEINLLSY